MKNVAKNSEFKLKRFAEEGWQIIDLDINYYKKLKIIFLKKIYETFPIFKNIQFDELRMKLNKLDKEINFIRSLIVPEISNLGILSAKKSLNLLFRKNKYLIQRNAHIDINKSEDIYSKTVTHSEIMAGHAPQTYTIWIPMHEINDCSGLFLLNLKKSLTVVDNFDVNKKEIKNFIYKNRFFPKLLESQAIIFSSFNLHGSDIHKNNKSRISTNFRIHPINKSLFQKDSLYFKIYE